MNKLILILFLFPIVSILSCSSNRYAVRFDPLERPHLQAQVLKVIDGDTVQVRTLNLSNYRTDGTNFIPPCQTNSVRMLFIDAPESSENVKLERNMLQYFSKGIYVRKVRVVALGKASKEHLNQILRAGDPVGLEFPSNEAIDKYGRFLAVVFKGDTNVNYRMVRDGFAVTYFLGSSAGPILRFYRKSFVFAEETAKKQELGIWKTLK